LTKLLQHEKEDAQTFGVKASLKDGRDVHMGALGSGSDYSPFLQHLGIASLNLGFGGSGGGIYHSIYDDPYWYLHFGDSTFVYGRALAQTMGTAVLRLADADVLPFEFTDFSDTLLRYQKEVEKLPKQEKGPAFDFTPLKGAIQHLRQAAGRYGKAYDAAAQSGALYREPAQQLDALNQILYHSERSLLDPAGLPGRPWYRHQIYAPGFFTGYGVKTLPGLREALEQKNWAQAAREQQVIVKALDAFTRQIQAAQAKLPGA
jgi:N-acetylated-alpha-linked acidic dipeptidase